MATSSGIHPGKMSFANMLARLEDMAKPVINDERQEKYCEYITMFLSYFGKERCFLTGSTVEQSRLRMNKDEGDFDYLGISGIVIPIECIEYRKDMPSFIHIDGRLLPNLYPRVKLIDDKYLPSSLLSDMQPQAFKHLRNIYQIVKRSSSFRGRNTLTFALNQKMKLGFSLHHYKGITCNEIPTFYKKPRRDEEKIRENVKKCLENKPQGFSYVALSSIKAIGNLVNEYDRVFSDSDNRTIFQQTFGPLVSAVENGENTQTGNETMQPELAKQIFNASNVTVNTSNTTSTSFGCTSEQTNTLEFKENNMTEGAYANNLNLIKIQYEYKTSKDFIPCFPLSGKPNHIEDWKLRKRVSNWPPQEVVDDIYNSEFFVVAKPAISQPEKNKDFCIAYNIPEKKLAKAMTSVQKDVLLIIKAIHKSFLAEYCDEITTFHWKTALYWESECVEPSLLQERTEDNVLSFLKRVLNRMKNSLVYAKLVHYFNTTNLFLGKKNEILNEVFKKVVEIQEQPIDLLRMFLLQQHDGRLREEWIPREKLEEFKMDEDDEGDTSLVAETLELLGTFANEDKQKVEAALTAVLSKALPFFIEETVRGKNKDTVDQTSHMIQSAHLKDVNQDSLVKDCVSLLVNHSIYNQQEISAKEIVAQFQELLAFQHAIGNLFSK